ncbi:hypothetical protein FRB90_005066 [Tulasnella sp. 427]|nr:hypothetical protein FRB90_005066 [Tulasnella sp. 427]
MSVPSASASTSGAAPNAALNTPPSIPSQSSPLNPLPNPSPSPSSLPPPPGTSLTLATATSPSGQPSSWTALASASRATGPRATTPPFPTFTNRWPTTSQSLSMPYRIASISRPPLCSTWASFRSSEMRRGDYTRWGLRDSDLFDEFLVGHRRQKPADQKKTNNKTGAPTEVCRNFNTGARASPCRGGRLHRCQTCGSEAHGANTHPAATPKNA